MPPCGFNQRTVRGALEFIKGCYEDLEHEVAEGKYKSIKEAIHTELGNLNRALTLLHIDEEGRLTERSP